VWGFACLISLRLTILSSSSSFSTQVIYHGVLSSSSTVTCTTPFHSYSFELCPNSTISEPSLIGTSTLPLTTIKSFLKVVYQAVCARTRIPNGRIKIAIRHLAYPNYKCALSRPHCGPWTSGSVPRVASPVMLCTAKSSRGHKNGFI
jgi:hypothetical protein